MMFSSPSKKIEQEKTEFKPGFIIKEIGESLKIKTEDSSRSLL